MCTGMEKEQDIKWLNKLNGSLVVQHLTILIKYRAKNHISSFCDQFWTNMIKACLETQFVKIKIFVQIL